MYSLLASKAVILLLWAQVALAKYTLTQDYTGANFFTGFTFETIPDPTHGTVNYVDKTTANQSALAGLFATNDTLPTTVYLGVDTTTKLSGGQEGRSSTRLSTNQTWNEALIIADIAHMPAGCGVWPAFWMLGTASPWPTSGEIDIVEGVNLQQTNIMTLHTGNGMTLNQSSPISLTGHVSSSNCDVNASDQPPNTGCQIRDRNGTASFGARFNANGGGVFATELAEQWIKIWFFPRGSIPSNIGSVTTAGTPSPSSWGVPNALFEPNEPGTIAKHFRDMQLVVNTALCGDWAGREWALSTDCAALAPRCEEYVRDNPTAFREAYWAIASLRVFQDVAG